MRECLIGLDVGTTSAKAVLFDLDGAELAYAESPFPLHMPQPGWVEQKTEDTWSGVVRTLKEVVERAGPDARPVALAVASQSGSLIPARADGAPVHPMITWMDGRTEAMVDGWQRDGRGISGGIAERVRRITGWQLHPGLPLAALAWLHAQRPDVCADATRYLCADDFVVHQLTGIFCANPSNAGVTQLVDVTTSNWSAELCALADVTADQFSPIRPAGQVVGCVTPEVSALTGLPPDTRVVVGGHDQGCTALALGVSEPGRVLLAGGTSWVVTGVASDAAVDGLPDVLDLNFHAVPGRWTVSQSLGGLGAALEWFIRQAWPAAYTRQQRYDELGTAIDATEPGSNGVTFVPVTGGHHAPASMQRGGFAGLQLGVTRAQMARAIMESGAYELRMALGEMAREGRPIERIWMVGGATRSSVWPGIVADVTGLPLRVTRCAHLPAVGAAILAGLGVGAFDTLEQGQTLFAQPIWELAPEPGRSGEYEHCFERYREALARVR